MRDWLATLHGEIEAGNAPLVRVVVATTRGSVPREAGACMLVSAERQWGTIGGGHLELVATRTARDMLAAPASPARLDRFPLAASLGQCCGGIVELWFQRYEAADAGALAEALEARARAAPEAIAALVSRDPDAARYERFSPEATPLWIFGAGHVGRALVDVSAALPFEITWVDSREDAFPSSRPANVRALHSPQPADEVADMPAGAWALVMTHSHDEDLALCEALLRDGRFGWAGVIGSLPKAKRFRQRLARRGFGEAAFARLAMPIGIEGIRSKEPAAIAVAVAAQLLRLREANAASIPASSAARAT